MIPDSPIVRRAKKIVDTGMNISVAQLQESIDMNDKLDSLERAIREIPQTIIPETIIPETDLSETNELLQQLIDKKDKPLDIKVSLKLV